METVGEIITKEAQMRDCADDLDITGRTVKIAGENRELLKRKFAK